MSEINQKEYLKKYLSIGKDPGSKKKKKKKVKNAGDRVKIIDDDVDISKTFDIPEEELFAANEDAPQIVGITDDRPLALKVDDYRKSDLWRPLGINNDDTDIKIKCEPGESPERNKIDNFGWVGAQLLSQNEGSSFKFGSFRIKTEINDDASLPKRKKRHESSCDKQRHRKQSVTIKQEVVSPPRKIKDEDISPPRKRRIDDDVSPPRKRRIDDDDDVSPPRRRKVNVEVNLPIKKRTDDDVSPLRKRRVDDDASPPRKRKSPPREGRINENIIPSKKTEDNLTPPRKNRNADFSPPRRHSKDLSPPRRKGGALERTDKERSVSRKPEPSNKMLTTLDGKVAGLQSADKLLKETEEFKKRENALFASMPAEVSGVNAVPVMRDRKTSKKRNLEQEAQEQVEKQKAEAQTKEKYTRWGKGLKQVEDLNQKIADDLHEMSKPLARYADDEDLERFLKEQEREGDPMLNYIRKKKKKKAIEEGKPLKPVYMGEFMPNRFGIPPGHRWDGVDRSNGYEKKWFEVQNAKQAQQEEIYKWSTEDM